MPSPRSIHSVSIIGAGLMGRGIAVANLKHGIPVTVTDNSADALEDGAIAIQKETSISQYAKLPGNPCEVASPAFLKSTVNQSELACSDLVIEAAVEKLSIKRQIFRRLEPLIGKRTILASNTSSIPITSIADDLQHPQRLCGMHFCHPVESRRLVEIIRGEKTSCETISAAVDYVQSIGKLPIVVNDAPGFVINRLLLPYMNEAVQLLAEGADIRQVENAAMAFGMPVGPLAQFDQYGIDVIVRAGAVLHAAFPERVISSNLLLELYQQGRLGQKSGVGFFSYPADVTHPTRCSEVDALIEKHRYRRDKFTAQEITMRLFLAMLVEATRILEDGIVSSPADIDLALIHGIGFPESKAGLLGWADSLGLPRVMSQLECLKPLGKRYEPTEMLIRMTAEGGRFHVHEDVRPQAA